MDRLTDLKRLMDIELARETKDEAEIAKLQGKIDKTLAVQAPAALPAPTENAPVATVLIDQPKPIL